ncbi:hypothetical protein N0V87_005635 [Didymella glomerata]|uniref:Transcriptional coactivator p15 (PC4) C-terminal domain-containing protein n=1 Tax=Didymella glomerata TaxID=749621 RepID=A0A9W8WY70_9PLEO|nr:hypothetical protein N0V87_005635 [Didymella glomerata]
MAGFKRGGFRGGGGGAFKKGYAKKRSPEDEDDAPRASKKSKGDDEEEENAPPFTPKLDTDDENNAFIALNNGGKRRVTISEFKGMTLVSIREYYTNDAGELKPGKKGIALSLDQYNAFLTAAPLLESVLSKRDVQVVRPNYDADLNPAEPDNEQEEEPRAVANVEEAKDED